MKTSSVQKKEKLANYSSDQQKVLKLLSEQSSSKGKRVLLMVAPSFVVDFDYKTFVPLMKCLGFDKVTELTFGAKIVNQHYHKYIKEHYSDYVRGANGSALKQKDKNFQSKFIATVCPSCVSLIQNKFPELKKYLLHFDSPLGAMAKIVHKNYPKHKIVFLAPCSAKKVEASNLKDKKGRCLIEAVVTFNEMKQIVEKKHALPLFTSHLFDSFYNDFTKIYPLSGGLSKTLHYKGILSKDEMVSCDGCTDIMALFKKHPKKVFYDILFCEGGCVGGPGVAARTPMFFRKYSMQGYVKVANKESMGGKEGLSKYTKGIDFSRKL